MQVIWVFPGSPEEYVAGLTHKEVPPPQTCPACGGEDSLESLGYYKRGLSKKGSQEVMDIVVRRFECTSCGVSVSLLPNFAQPYRLVRCEFIQTFFDGNRGEDDVRRWAHLLRRYSRRFFRWFPELLVRTSVHPSRSPPQATFGRFWSLFNDLWGTLAQATRKLVGEFRVTAFGAYRCHAVPAN